MKVYEIIENIFTSYCKYVLGNISKWYV